jgi:hypothetical protein
MIRNTGIRIGTMDWGRGWGLQLWVYGHRWIYWQYTFKRFRCP